MNIVVDESVPWAAIEATTTEAGGSLVEAITFTDDSFRDPEQLGKGSKSVVFRVQLRSHEGTLTSEQADAVISTIVAALKQQLDGELRA